MNKKTREQLRACIAKDLIQGQGQHYPTKKLLKQYVPLEGIVTTPASDVSSRPGPVPVENTMAPHATVAPRANNKYDDDIKIKSSSKGEKSRVDMDPVENHSCAAAPRERRENAEEDFLLIRAAYEKATGNRWSKADSEAYHQNGIGRSQSPFPSTLDILPDELLL